MASITGVRVAAVAAEPRHLVAGALPQVCHAAAQVPSASDRDPHLLPPFSTQDNAAIDGERLARDRRSVVATVGEAEARGEGLVLTAIESRRQLGDRLG